MTNEIGEVKLYDYYVDVIYTESTTIGLLLIRWKTYVISLNLNVD